MKHKRSNWLLFGEHHMKLPLITASVVAYLLLATAWICYTELMPD